MQRSHHRRPVSERKSDLVFGLTFESSSTFSVPSPALDEAVGPVDVEALLPVPAVRASGGCVCLGGGELALVREDEGADSNGVFASTA